MATGCRSAKDKDESEFNWNGCFIVLMSFGMTALCGVVFKCLGVLLPKLTEQFVTSTWLIGILVSAMSVSADVTGIFTAVLDEKFGSRTILMLSALMISGGIILLTAATSVVHIALCLILLVGPGLGVAVILNKTVLGRHFTKHYTTVCGISHSGEAFSILAVAPLTLFFLEVYGWRGAVLLIGAICMHTVAASARVKEKPHEAEYKLIENQPSTVQLDSDIGRSKTSEDTNRLKALFNQVDRVIDLRLLVECNFWIAFSSVTCVRLIHDFWTVYFVPHLQVKGCTPMVIANLCTVAAVGYLIGTVIFAPLIHKDLVKCSTTMAAVNVISSVSLLVDPWVNDIPGLVVITFVFGASMSAMFTLSDVLARELVGIDRLSTAFAWIGILSCVTRLMADFLPGLIFDNTGSYDMAFIGLSLTALTNIIPLAIGKLRKVI